MYDKIKALSAPPGHSLTGTPGKWAWEQPPRFADPNDAIDFIIDKLEDKAPQEDMLRLLSAGITIEELVNQISFKGFMEGTYSPDVAELIKPALTMYFLTLSLDSGFTPRMFIEEEPEKQVTDERFLSIMQERNPEVFAMMNEEINKGAEIEEKIAMQEATGEGEEPQGMMGEQPINDGGFLDPKLEEEIS